MLINVNFKSKEVFLELLRVTEILILDYTPGFMDEYGDQDPGEWHLSEPLDVTAFVDLPKPVALAAGCFLTNSITIDESGDSAGQGYADIDDKLIDKIALELETHGLILDNDGVIIIDTSLSNFIRLDGLTHRDLMEIMVEFTVNTVDATISSDTINIPGKGLCDVYEFDNEVDVSDYLRFTGQTEVVDFSAYTTALVMPKDVDNVVLAAFNDENYKDVTNMLRIYHKVTVDESGHLIAPQ